ncbi:MAG: serine/threonine-protein phosphatase [Acidobacteria bacterium]|nr:serine/threonine-protein phosphatase [Acidobacteriota bacterium]
MQSADGILDWTDELENLQSIVRCFSPSSGDLPKLSGIDIYGGSFPLNGIIGGDHIIYVDFKKRYDLEARMRKAETAGRLDVAQKLRDCRRKAAIALADVSGHRLTDVSLAMMLHQAFLLGALYELDFHGDITTRLFENLNTRFYQSSCVNKFVTLIYGEISESGTFRFISAGHPPPVVFSCYYDRIMNISEDLLIAFPPIGTIPSWDDIDRQTISSVLGYKENYEVNEINLMGAGDILLLYTDGLSELSCGAEPFFPGRVEAILRNVKDRCAKDIFESLREDLFQFGVPHDDISCVVIKRN